jgi:TonB family protein
MFWGSLGLSLAIHAIFLAVLSMPQSPLKPPAIKKTIEVAYDRVVGTQKPLAPPPDQARPETQKFRLPSLPPVKPEDTLMKKQREAVRKEIFKDALSVSEVPFKKIISLPNIPGEIFKTPEYKSYYQVIREKIRKLAYFNYKRLEEGEVFLTFSLTQEGALSDLAVSIPKSTNNVYLRATAERSVREAAPYPPFPEKLRENKKLSFNVIISFELK